MKVAVALAALVAAAAAVMVEGTRASYDQSFAIDMVYKAAAAYCDATTLQSYTCNACVVPGFNVTRVVSSEKYNLQGYVGYSSTNDAIVVAFRGTQEKSIKNWILNLKATHTTTTYPHCTSTCKVDEGFYTAHEALKAQVVPEVHFLKNQHPTAQLYITGHSLGAAMAVLSAAHIQTQEGVNVDALYTFGQPRVGDSVFSAWFNTVLPEAVHVTHYHDIVPHLPPESFGYHHTPTEVWYDVETGLQYKVCNGSGEDPTCADSVDWWDFSVDDHFTYLDIYIVDCTSLPWPPTVTAATAAHLRGTN